MGKFSPKTNAPQSDIYAILEERNRNQKRKAPTAQPAPNQGSSKPSRPAAPQEPRRESRNSAPRQVPPVSRQTPPPARQEPPAQFQESGKSLSGLVFAVGCMAFVFVFYLATFVGLNIFRDWLVRFEAAQPDAKSEEVFQDLFAHPDWEKLYEVAQLDKTGAQGKDAFVAYMRDKVGGEPLTYMETSAGLSGNKKYVVRTEDERIAVFTLADRNEGEGAAEVPDWQLEQLEFYIRFQEKYLVRVSEGSTVYVNGQQLGEDACVVKRVSRAADYIPTFAPVPKEQVYQVRGLVTAPEVTVKDAAGKDVQVSYDESTGIFTGVTPQPQLTQEHKDLSLEAIRTYALYMSGKASKGDLGKYFDRNSDAYKNITEADLNWVQTGSDYTFTDESVTDYRLYGEDIFSVRVSVNLNITRKEDGSVKENPISQSMFFTLNSSGEWVCFQMTAVDAGQWVEQVKLTFMDGETVLSSEYVEAEASAVTCPAVTAPEGKTFRGWVVEETDENGQQVMRLVFTPDETGNVPIPSGTTLEPMTLIAFFE